MAVVLDIASDVTGEWATVGVFRDNLFVLLCLTPTAPICRLVML